MKKIITKTQEFDNCIQVFFEKESTVLFDIETTGFNSDTTLLYLIGCSYYKDNHWNIIQWFNDDGISELQILNEFFSFIKDYNRLISYNGEGFDMPYIIHKLKKYNLSYTFDDIESIDIYKLLRPYKNMLHLDNLKQKSIELLLGIHRLDKYSGKDLIKVYNQYLTDKNKLKETVILQHNYEDLEGLMSIFSLLAYPKLEQGYFHVNKMSVKENQLVFSFLLDYSIPKRITCTFEGLNFTAHKNSATLYVPIINDTLKFFFDNYNEYYYLPVEDTAVHKSVASFVDKNYKTKATKQNCYTKKQGYFITQLNTNFIHGFKHYYEEKYSYIELVDSFLKDQDKINCYASNIVKVLLKKG